MKLWLVLNFLSLELSATETLRNVSVYCPSGGYIEFSVSTGKVESVVIDDYASTFYTVTLKDGKVFHVPVNSCYVGQGVDKMRDFPKD